MDDQKKIWNLSISKICANLVNTFIGIADDVTQVRKQSLYELFTREDRLTYVGLMFVIIGLIIMFHNQLKTRYNTREIYPPLNVQV
jgi:hypothetical protein